MQLFFIAFLHVTVMICVLFSLMILVDMCLLFDNNGVVNDSSSLTTALSINVFDLSNLTLCCDIQLVVSS